MAEAPVRYEGRDRIAHVTLDDGKANALSPEVLARLSDCLTRAEEAGEEVGALLISGRPGFFSGGFDLKVMRTGADAAGALVSEGGAFFARIFGSPVPVIAACTGHALAAGALLLMACDYRVGARGDFKIGLPETALGMVLPRWAVELSRERLSVRHFQQATVGARAYDADGAVEAGLLDAAADPADVARLALEEAQRWAGLPRWAYQGQVKANRGECVARLEEALAADRGRSFEIRP